MGLIENMSGFVCPHCSECTNIFSTGGGNALANHTNIPFIGRIPIDPTIGIAMEQGVDFIDSNPNSPTLSVVSSFVSQKIQLDEQTGN